VSKVQKLSHNIDPDNHLMAEEQDLIQACAKGDRLAQRELYQKYARSMYVVCLRYTKSAPEAEDVLQESFVKVFRNIGKFRGESRLVYWIKRIVVNTALNHQRSKLRMLPVVDVADVSDNLNYDQFLTGYNLEQLLAMVQQLPTGCRLVFNMFAVEGYSHKEIGEMLDISEGTSKSQYSRARKLLQAKIEEDQKSRYEKYR
jgi:RNA polymerase sigma factor (sigma-70 family)